MYHRARLLFANPDEIRGGHQGNPRARLKGRKGVSTAEYAPTAAAVGARLSVTHPGSPRNEKSEAAMQVIFQN